MLYGRRVIMHRILVALDGSKESEQVLDEVERVAARDSSIDLIHVLPGVPHHEVPGVGADREDIAEQYLRKAASRFEGRGVRTFIWRGQPDEEIPKAARSLNADLIAMTTHGRKGLSHLLLGSVAESVVRNVSVPVLLTRPDLARPRKPLERILVPVDGTERSLEVTATVRDLSAGTGAEVILLQVVVPVVVADPVTGFSPIGVPMPLPDPTPQLEDVARRLSGEGAPARAVVAYGAAADQILDHAKALDADLIAMATAGRKGLSRFMIGSVAESVVRRMDRPVLLHRIAPKAEAETRVQEMHVQGAD
jgi:nucleotide-binding universal stress UspA family protein